VEQDYFSFIITTEVHDLIELVMVRVHRVRDWIFYISFVFIIFTSIYLCFASHRLGRLQRNH
jgi:ABC-type nickel/cobalt efflux system permease component RcnA